MKRLITIGFCLTLVINAHSQNKSQLKQAITCFNNSQNFIYNKPNADSAFFWIRKLASNNSYEDLLTHFLHDSFVQAFVPKNLASTDTGKIDFANSEKQRILSKEILSKIMSDTTKLLKQAARPIYFWVKIQENSNNLSELKRLTNKYIDQELSSGDIYKNRVGRYGLLIYQTISKQTGLKALAERLFALIYSDLKNNQIVVTDSSSRTDLDERAWYRYLFAYVNYLEAQKYAYVNYKGEEKAHSLNKEETYLRIAFDYSPDLTDENHSSECYYDMVFLTGKEKRSFKENYLTFLINSDTNKKKVLKILLNIALVEPEYKNRLKEYYEANNTTSTDFNNYWEQAINSNAKAASPILLKMLNNKLFSSKNSSGKWIMVDFWGTWCMPCRKEQPKLQKFYSSVILKNTKDITLLTIACKDTKQRVLKYMKEKKYDFPVAMADNKVEKAYSVHSYPTKVLITPEGNFITIPYYVNWVDFVKQYCSL